MADGPICPDCGGSGRLELFNSIEQCSRCGGTGKLLLKTISTVEELAEYYARTGLEECKPAELGPSPLKPLLTKLSRDQQIYEDAFRALGPGPGKDGH